MPVANGGRRFGPRSASRDILGGSAGNLVEWYDWYAYSVADDLFRAGFLSEGGRDRATAQRRRDLRRRLPDAADRRLDDGRLFRPPWAQVWANLSVALMAGGSLMIACRADLCDGRLGRAGGPGARANVAGAVGRRRIWRQRDLSVRNGDAQSPRVLGELPVHHADRRPACSRWRVVVLLQASMSDAEMQEWGWRVAFGIGAVLAFGVYVLRARLTRNGIVRQAGRGSGQVVDHQPVARSSA